MTAKRWFECPECDYSTEDNKILDALKRNMHGDPICPECGSNMGVEYDLRQK